MKKIIATNIESIKKTNTITVPGHLQWKGVPADVNALFNVMRKGLRSIEILENKEMIRCYKKSEITVTRLRGHIAEFLKDHYQSKSFNKFFIDYISHWIHSIKDQNQLTKSGLPKLMTESQQIRQLIGRNHSKSEIQTRLQKTSLFKELFKKDQELTPTQELILVYSGSVANELDDVLGGNMELAIIEHIFKSKNIQFMQCQSNPYNEGDNITSYPLPIEIQVNDHELEFKLRPINTDTPETPIQHIFITQNQPGLYMESFVSDTDTEATFLDRLSKNTYFRYALANTLFYHGYHPIEEEFIQKPECFKDDSESNHNQLKFFLSNDLQGWIVFHGFKARKNKNGQSRTFKGPFRNIASTPVGDPTLVSNAYGTHLVKVSQEQKVSCKRLRSYELKEFSQNDIKNTYSQGLSHKKTQQDQTSLEREKYHETGKTHKKGLQKEQEKEEEHGQFNEQKHCDTKGVHLSQVMNLSQRTEEGQQDQISHLLSLNQSQGQTHTQGRIKSNREKKIEQEAKVSQNETGNTHTTGQSHSNINLDETNWSAQETSGSSETDTTSDLYSGEVSVEASVPFLKSKVKASYKKNTSHSDTKHQSSSNQKGGRAQSSKSDSESHSNSKTDRHSISSETRQSEEKESGVEDQTQKAIEQLKGIRDDISEETIDHLIQSLEQGIQDETGKDQTQEIASIINNQIRETGRTSISETLEGIKNKIISSRHKKSSKKSFTKITGHSLQDSDEIKRVLGDQARLIDEDVNIDTETNKEEIQFSITGKGLVKIEHKTTKMGYFIDYQQPCISIYIEQAYQFSPLFVQKTVMSHINESMITIQGQDYQILREEENKLLLKSTDKDNPIQVTSTDLINLNPKLKLNALKISPEVSQILDHSNPTPFLEEIRSDQHFLNSQKTTAHAHAKELLEPKMWKIRKYGATKLEIHSQFHECINQDKGE